MLKKERIFNILIDKRNANQNNIEIFFSPQEECQSSRNQKQMLVQMCVHVHVFVYMK
jgi:hypothetical protein